MADSPSDTAHPDSAHPDIAHPGTFARGVPHAEFACRRRDEPVGWVGEPLLVRHGTQGHVAARGSGFWAVTRHADVLSVSRRPEVFSSAAKGAFLTDPRTPADLRQARQLLVNMDAPQHVRIRRLVTDPRMRAGSSSSSSSARARGAPASGNARLSYRRAEEIFEQTTGRAGQPRAHLRRLTYERGAGP